MSFAGATEQVLIVSFGLLVIKELIALVKHIMERRNGTNSDLSQLMQLLTEGRTAREEKLSGILAAIEEGNSLALKQLSKLGEVLDKVDRSQELMQVSITKICKMSETTQQRVESIDKSSDKLLSQFELSVSKSLQRVEDNIDLIVRNTK